MKCSPVNRLLLSMFISVVLLFGVASLAYADSPAKARSVSLSEAMQVVPTVTYDSNTFSSQISSRASAYYSTLYFGGHGITKTIGATRYYDGQNVSISMTASSSGSGSACDPYFSVELHRAHGIFNDYVGSAAFKRDGFTGASWSNVGSGNYYFVFVKCDDGKYISSSDVHMMSWG